MNDVKSQTDTFSRKNFDSKGSEEHTVLEQCTTVLEHLKQNLPCLACLDYRCVGRLIRFKKTGKSRPHLSESYMEKILFFSNAR